MNELIENYNYLKSFLYEQMEKNKEESHIDDMIINKLTRTIKRVDLMRKIKRVKNIK